MITFLIALLDSLLIFTAFLVFLFCLLVLYIPGTMTENLLAPLRDLVLNRDALATWQYTAIFFFSLTFFSMALRFRRYYRARDLFFISAKGNAVQIANQAVTDFIRKLVASVEGVTSAHVRVLCNPRRSKVFIVITLEMLEGNAYPEVNARIQDLVKAKLATEMGIEKIGSIAVTLKRVQPREAVPLPG